MKKIISNIAAGATQAAIVVAFIVVSFTWRETDVASRIDLSPTMIFQAFIIFAVTMAFAFGVVQALWDVIAADIGLKGMLTDVTGCAATMLLFGGLWLAKGGMEREFALATVALATTGAAIAGCVRYWVAARLGAKTRSA